jgi:hypothetical protein
MRSVIAIALILITTSGTFALVQKESGKQDPKKHVINALFKTADSDKYGFTSHNPVKVGTGPNGGPANQRAYLDLLRDSHGNAIKYQRLQSCCSYETPNGLMGYGMLDKYEITYRDEQDNTKKAIVYLTFYDYEEPMIIKGFKTSK